MQPRTELSTPGVPMGPLPAQTDTGLPRLGLHTAGRRATKRALDCALAGSLLLVLAPLLAVIAAAIRLGSPGPALFRQTRVGRGNQPFVILKFRTMRSDASDAIVQARTADPRITRIGRVLRRTSLDELPQLWNVLRGEMSLVGPRPHAPGTPAAGHPIEWIPGYAARHAVRPGLTGLAQVRGYRGETDTRAKAQARLDSDLEYVRSWSVGKDVSILARTAVAIVRGVNAV